MSIIKKIVPLLAVTALALSGCAGASSEELPPDTNPGSSGGDGTSGAPIPIEGIDGSWTFAGGTDSAGTLDANDTVTLVISGDSFSGQGACNSYSATFAGEPTELKLGPIASTQRSCENALMDFDTRYFSALAVATVAIPTGGSLVLQGDGVTLDFLPDASGPTG